MINITVLKRFALAVIFLMMLQQSGWAESADVREELDGIHVRWRSNNKNADQLALAIEKLYMVLYNTGNLPTREIVFGPERC